MIQHVAFWVVCSKRELTNCCKRRIQVTNMRLDLEISDELGFPSEGTARVRRERTHTNTRVRAEHVKPSFGNGKRTTSLTSERETKDMKEAKKKRDSRSRKAKSDSAFLFLSLVLFYINLDKSRK